MLFTPLGLIETPSSERSGRLHGKNTFLVARSTTTMYAPPTSYHVDVDLRSPQTTSKESKWDMPEELVLLMEKVEKETKESPAPPASSYAP